jgi:hypothetical protein
MSSYHPAMTERNHNAKAATIRRWFELSERKDWAAVSELIDVNAYFWLDHTVGTAARTAEELAEAMAEEAWDDIHFEIDSITEGHDGRIFVQLTRSGTLSQGSVWRGVHGAGQTVTRTAIDIFTFNEAGKIVGEELYEDALSIMRQLGQG